MVHTFKNNGDFFAYDVESGSLFEVDELSKLLVDRRSGAAVDLSAYSEEEISACEKEIDELAESGSMFAKPADVKIDTYSKEIKAMCLHICHDCNLKCEYCFADEGKYCGEREYMTFEVGKNAVDFLISNSGNRKNLEIDFFGGEPLMNIDVVRRIADYAKGEAAKRGKEFKFTLTTNSVLLSDEIIDYLNAEMDNVVLSLDGRKEIHDNVRKTINNKGSFDLALKNSKAFRAKRGNKSYYVRGTFTANNLDFYKDVLFINDCGFDQVSIEPVVLPDSNKLAIKREHIAAINDSYEKLTKEYVIRRKSGDKWFNFFHFYLDMDNPPCLIKRMKGCGAGNEYIAVSPKGEIFPCHQFVGNNAYIMGNVFDKALNEQIKTTFARANLTTKPDCKDCFAKYNCSGGCAANNINYSGDINKPYKISCEMMRKRLECALYIKAQEK